MNKDMARKLIALVAMKKAVGYSRSDFINTLSFKRALLPPDVVERFIEASLNEKLIVEKDGKYVPNFSTEGVIVPLDFSVDVDELFSEAAEKPLIDRMLEAASASGKMTKKEAIIKARDLLSGMQFIDFETAMVTVLSDAGIDISSFVAEKENNSGYSQ
ncbi:MAG: DUF2240 family protein [Ferroplasma sp.]|uniref:DUF2240 family protein n=1 Tax=Ferroplasma sp. TaxID=2591003 RepID=UPI002816246C|nr:DUF2240 family protein [Ferroplasma sp.]WMT51099.1 MAG: DUF2240 family protein [Ferroplasma sp.]